jgi:ABC-type uncharacterized transport system involved in gliding motility auxiliary subunit
MALGAGRWRQAVIGTLLVCLLLVLVNYLAQHYAWRWDATAARLHSLSEQTMTLLAALPQDVRILAFYDADHPARLQVQELLQAYAYESPRLRWEFVDAVRQAGKARHYQVNEQGTVVVESGAQLARLDGLADLGPSEEQLTNALIRVTRQQAQRICVVQGHGERATDDTSPAGLRSFHHALEAEGYAVQRLVPLTDPTASGCSVLIIAGPTAELAMSEQQALDHYLAQGGRALFLLGAGAPLALHTALRQWGVRVGETLLLDPLATVFGADPVAPVITTYGAHESLKDFRLVTFFPWSRPIAPLDPPPIGRRVTPLLWSSPQSWSRPYQVNRRPEAINSTFVPETDVKGPHPLGVAVEAETTRLVVLGTTDIVANQYFLLFGHKNLLLNLMAWLAAQPDLIAVKPPVAGTQVILLSAAQARTLFYAVILAYPVAIFVTGLGVWGWRRRQ